MAAVAWAGGPSLTHLLLCEDMSLRLGELYPHSRRHAICSNAAFLAQASPPAKSGDSVPVFRLGHLSNLSTSKGFGVVLDIFDALIEAGLPVVLKLAGPTHDAASETRLRTLMASPLADRVAYWGPLSRQEVVSFMQELDLFLFPSNYSNEAEPLVVLEALSAGVPCMAFPVGCLTCLPQTMLPLSVNEMHAAVRAAVLNFMENPQGVAAARSELRRSADQSLARFEPSNSHVLVEALRL